MYEEDVLRTESNDFPAIRDRLQREDTIRLLHAAMGLSTEAGEFLDMLKKHIFYGKELDEVNAKEEIGDTFWYAGIAVDVLRTTFKELQDKNIEKLRARYPEHFTSEDALTRDLDKERSILQQKK